MRVAMSHPMTSNCMNDLETICGTLASVVKSGFGPRGHVTLMSSSTGHVSLSTDGLIILSSLRLSHPVARSIIKSLNSFIVHNGDGCKTIILYLSSLFVAMRKELVKQSMAVTIGDETFVMAFFSRCLFSFLTHHMPVIFKEMRENVVTNVTENLRSQNLEDIICNVMKTILNGVPSNHCLLYLAKAVTKYLTDGCISLKEIRDSCDYFNHSVFLIPHQMISASHAVNGIHLASRLYSNKESLVDVTFLGMLCSVDGARNDDSNTDAFTLNKPEVLVGHKHSVVQQFISSLKKRSISVIITSSKVQDSFLQLFEESHIGVISCIDEDDIHWICNVCKKSPVTSIREDIDPGNLMKATFHQTSFAKHFYTRIVLSIGFKCPNTLFLCGPSEGICEQLKIKTKKGMTAISQLLDHAITQKEEADFNTLLPHLKVCSNIINGGGYFERLLCAYLRKYSENSYSSETKMCCSLVQSMLWSVPEGLSEQQCDKSRLSDLLKFKVHSLELVNSDIGFNQQDYPSTISGCNALEVLSVKIASVYTTITLAASLLKMDKIISVHSRSNEECGLDNI